MQILSIFLDFLIICGIIVSDLRDVSLYFLKGESENCYFWRLLAMNSSSVVVTESQQDEVILKKRIRNFLYLSFKRVFDIIIGIVGIILIIPLAFIIKAVSIINRDYHSIFLKQKRIGKDGKLFTMYKFRTMVPGADELLVEILQTNEDLRKEYTLTKKMKDDPRVTKIGKVLRKTSIDEVPQFINVFLGHMSLIGNRPYLPREKEDMGLYYDTIVKTRPGITGLWQVSGRSNTTFQERLEIEKRYSQIYSLKLDIKIFFKTIVLVLKKDGAN